MPDYPNFNDACPENTVPVLPVPDAAGGAAAIGVRPKNAVNCIGAVGSG